MALAEKLDGVVINADSMQVYAELRILTARPSVEEEARVPHALYGHVLGSVAYSTGQYARDARLAIASAQEAGRMPIIVGGTGLYFRALLEGLSPIPEIPGDVREHWRGEARRAGAADLHARLSERDPVMAAKLQPTDTQRVTRALEVLEATGRSLADWQSEAGKPVLREDETVRFVVMPERDQIRSRCDARFDAMMVDGALDEVQALQRLNRSTELPVMRALGVKPLMQVIEGTLARETAVEQAKAETRQYVKRQTTWLRRNMITWRYIYSQQMKSIDELNVSFIDC